MALKLRQVNKISVNVHPTEEECITGFGVSVSILGLTGCWLSWLSIRLGIEGLLVRAFYCVLSLSKTPYPLVSIRSNQEDRKLS